MTPILTVTLNPALDITTTTERLVHQQKLRCSAPRYDPGGGGVNVSRAIRELGGESTAFVALGGSTGTQYRALLEAAGIDCVYWEQQGDTRFSLTVMESATGLHYRFVLPGPPQPEGEAARLLARLDELIASGVRFVALSGSLPPGLPDDFYGRLAGMARKAGAAVVLDAHGAALREALPFRPYLIRLNHLEAQELLGGEAGAPVHLLARQLIERGSAEVTIVTAGEEGAVVATPGRELMIRAPHVEVVSAVGAGDSFVGALVVGLSRGWPLQTAARYGVAAAAATVTTAATELCSADVVDRLFAEIPPEPELIVDPA
jgi:6-phosphofructokinase 2